MEYERRGELGDEGGAEGTDEMVKEVAVNGR